MNSAIIVAGGIGKRAKSKTPKQFIKINNKRIIDFSIRIFKANKYINEIIIAVCKGWDDIISSENLDDVEIHSPETRLEIKNALLNSYGRYIVC